jgi:hypothetical protein
MKFIFKILFLFLIVSPIFGESPHLLLYFDINKTLIASDQAGGKSVDDVLNQLLSCEYHFKWDSSIQEPISYDTYVRNVLLTGSEHDLELKERRRFYLDHFIDYLREQNHPLYSKALTTYNAALQKLEGSQGIVFPSFYYLLNELDREGVAYTLILRSFGTEVFEIADEINNAILQKKFNHSGLFNQGTLLIDNEIKGNNPTEIYRILCSVDHIAIRDDWEHWMKGEMGSQYGKPFIVDRNNDRILEVFFDDNINLIDNKKNIISPIDANTGSPIAIKELADQHQIVRVDTLQAILNDNYFIEHVQEAIFNSQSK